MRRSTWILPLVLTAIIACSGGKNSQTPDGAAKAPGASRQQQIAPGTATIVGTIVSISEDRSTDGASPCSKAACIAVVRVDEVIGYGSGFTGTLSNGREITVFFAFTLAPTTKDLFPHMDATYPGLDVGAVFQANISFSPRMAGDTQSPAYTIYDYSRQD